MILIRVLPLEDPKLRYIFVWETLHGEPIQGEPISRVTRFNIKEFRETNL